MDSLTSTAKKSSNPSQIVLRILGKYATIAEWSNTLKELGAYNPLPFEDGFNVIGHGWRMHFLWLDSVETSTRDPKQLGLHSITLSTENDDSSATHWLHDWPFGLHAQGLTKVAVLPPLGKAMIDTRNLSLFEYYVDTKGTTYAIGVQCEWNQQQKLVRMTLARLDDFDLLHCH